MNLLNEVPEPSDAELWAIECEADLQAAELALVDAEVALLTSPSNVTAVVYLRALLDVVDLHDFTDDWSSSSADHSSASGYQSRLAATPVEARS